MIFRQLGKVIVLGDLNSRIGQIASEIETDQKYIFNRITHEKKKIPPVTRRRGKDLIEAMNVCNMIIMNGIDSGPDMTYVNSKKEKAILDYIILSDDLVRFVKKTDDITRYKHHSLKIWHEYDCQISDHKLISCELKLQKQCIVRTTRNKEQRERK